MFALKDYVGSELQETQPRLVDMSRFSYGCAVAFTDAEMPEGSPKPPLPVYGHRAVQDGSLWTDLAEYARRLPTKKVRRQLQNQMFRQTMKWQLDIVRRLLMPDFKMQYASATRPALDSINAELLRLTEDQYEALRQTELNPRCVIDGAAGTGKSLLALELARRRHAAGDRVAILCQNYNLGDWFQSQVPPGLPAGSTGQVVESILGNDPTRQARLRQRSAQFHEAVWINALLQSPDKALDDFSEFTDFLLTEYAEMKDPPQFDYLIVDEGQLVCEEPILRIIDVILRDGLGGGSWTIFGDFANQRLSDASNGPSPRDQLREFCTYWTEGHLQTNCRNTQPIADATARATGFDLPETSGVDGPPVKTLYWRNAERLADLVDEEVSRLRREDVRHRDLFLLSTAALGPIEGVGMGGVLDVERSYGGWKLFPRGYSAERSAFGRPGAVAPGYAHLNYTDVVMFQGLESDVVLLIVTPPSWSTSWDIESALYVGMSRARGALIVLAHEDWRDIVE